MNSASGVELVNAGPEACVRRAAPGCDVVRPLASPASIPLPVHSKNYFLEINKKAKYDLSRQILKPRKSFTQEKHFHVRLMREFAPMLNRTLFFFTVISKT